MCRVNMHVNSFGHLCLLHAFQILGSPEELPDRVADQWYPGVDHWGLMWIWCVVQPPMDADDEYNSRNEEDKRHGML